VEGVIYHLHNTYQLVVDVEKLDIMSTTHTIPLQTTPKEDKRGRFVEGCVVYHFGDLNRDLVTPVGTTT